MVQSFMNLTIVNDLFGLMWFMMQFHGLVCYEIGLVNAGSRNEAVMFRIHEFNPQG